MQHRISRYIMIVVFVYSNSVYYNVSMYKSTLQMTTMSLNTFDAKYGALQARLHVGTCNSYMFPEINRRIVIKIDQEDSFTKNLLRFSTQNPVFL